MHPSAAGKADASSRLLPRFVALEWFVGALLCLTIALLATEIALVLRLDREMVGTPALGQGIQSSIWGLTLVTLLAGIVALALFTRVRRRDRAANAELEKRVQERTETLANEIAARRTIENELRAAQARLKLALNAAHTCTWDVDIPSGQVWLDAPWSAMLGGESRETRTSTRALIAKTHPEDRRRVASDIKRCVSGEAEEYCTEQRVRRLDGGWLWVVSRGRVIEYDALGRPRRIIGANTDITERKRAEESMRRQMAFLTALNETTLDLLNCRAEDELLQAIVERVAALLEVPHVELALVEADSLVVRAHLGRTIVAPGERASRQQVPLRWQAIDSHMPVVVDNYPRARGHDTGFHSVAVLPVLHRGRCLGVITLSRDVPDHPFSREAIDHGISFTQLAALVLHNATVYHDAVRTAEDRMRQVRENEERFRAVFSQSPIPLLLTSPTDARILEANHASLALFGYTRDEVIGRSSAELGIWAEGPQRDEYFRLLRAHGVVDGMEATMRTKTGGLLDMFCTGSVIKADQRPLVLSSAVDITARKRAEADRAKLEQSLRQAQKLESIGTLAGGIAHDFNNVLTGIFGFIDLARLELPPGHPAIGWLDHMFTTSQRARDLVRQILTFSRRSEGERRAQRIQPVIEEALRLLRSTLPPMVELVPMVSRTTPPAMVDATQIHQIVMNLCTNAWHALPPGGGRIAVTLEPWFVAPGQAVMGTDLAPGSYVRLSVTDNGCGMTPAVAERVFEPFFTTKEAGKGSGLGLAVVHGIVQSHGGAITLHTVPGRGTTFELYFPAIETTEISRLSPRPTAQRGNEERLLVVDDDPASGFALEQILLSLGYRVRRFERAIDLLLHFRHAPNGCDAVVADLAMPGLTGDVLARELLRLRPSLPILIVTGLIDPARQQELQRDGVRLVLRKPLGTEELSRHVRTLLTAEPTTAATEASRPAVSP